MDAKLAQANGARADRRKEVGLQDLHLLIDGGRLRTPIRDFDLLGLRNAERTLRGTITQLPPGSRQRESLQRGGGFAGLARGGLGLARGGWTTVSRPVAVQRTVVEGRRTPLDSFAVVV